MALVGVVRVVGGESCGKEERHGAGRGDEDSSSYAMVVVVVVKRAKRYGQS